MAPAPGSTESGPRAGPSSAALFLLDEGDSAVIKPDLFSHICLEVREPLNSIIGFCDLMVRGKTGPLSDAQQGCLERVLANARQLAQILNDVGELARLENGRVELREETID